MKKTIYGCLILSIIQSVLFWHKNLGISVLLFLIPAITLIIYSLNENKKVKNKKAILWAIPIILLGLTYFIFNNGLFQIFNIPIIFTLLIIMCQEITGQKLTDNRIIKNILKKTFKPFSVIFRFLNDFKFKDYISITQEEKSNKIESIKKIVKSIFITVPILLVIIALLASADSIFGNLFGSITKGITNVIATRSISDFIKRLIYILIFFAYSTGFILSFIKETEMQEKQIKKIIFNSLTAKMILISLNLTYVVFNIIQIKYLFLSAGKTSDFNYAVYARKGFFQLMIVSIINLAILRTIKYEQEKIIKILKSVLIISTIIIIISAMFRMYLYEQAYGYTYLRLFVYFILATEILIFITILASLFNYNINSFDMSLKIVITMYIALNFINIDYIIARNNINRYLVNPEENDIDIYYITSATGTDAMNEKIRLLNISIDNLSVERKEYLNQIKQKIKLNLKGYKESYKKIDWQEYNLSKIKAKNLETTNIDI